MSGPLDYLTSPPSSIRETDSYNTGQKAELENFTNYLFKLQSQQKTKHTWTLCPHRSMHNVVQKHTYTNSIQFNSIDSPNIFTYWSMIRFLMLPLIFGTSCLHLKDRHFTIQQFTFLTQDVRHNGYQYEVHFISAVSWLRGFSFTPFTVIINRLLALEIYLSSVF